MLASQKNVDREDEALWRAVADQAKRREAMRRVGPAAVAGTRVLERARSDRDKPHLWKQISVANERCSRRSAAIETGRHLMAEKAAWPDADIEIGGTIWSVLERRSEDE